VDIVGYKRRDERGATRKREATREEMKGGQLEKEKLPENSEMCGNSRKV